ncbi:MAG: hypothetical protein AB1767_00620 [Bacillota bacterium]
MAIWIQFLLSAAVNVWAGNRLTRCTKMIAVQSGIGVAWAGVLMLPLIDLAHGRGPLTTRVHQGHILTASLSIITASLVSLAMLSNIFFQVAWIGSKTLLIASIYLFGSRLLYRYDKKNNPMFLVPIV